MFSCFYDVISLCFLIFVSLHLTSCHAKQAHAPKYEKVREKAHAPRPKSLDQDQKLEAKTEWMALDAQVVAAFVVRILASFGGLYSSR